MRHPPSVDEVRDREASRRRAFAPRPRRDASQRASAIGCGSRSGETAQASSWLDRLRRRRGRRPSDGQVSAGVRTGDDEDCRQREELRPGSPGAPLDPRLRGLGRRSATRRAPRQRCAAAGVLPPRSRPFTQYLPLGSGRVAHGLEAHTSKENGRWGSTGSRSGRRGDRDRGTGTRADRTAGSAGASCPNRPRPPASRSEQVAVVQAEADGASAASHRVRRWRSAGLACGEPLHVLTLAAAEAERAARASFCVPACPSSM